MKLTINDKDYQLEWGMGAIEKYCDIRDCDIDDIDTHLGSAKLIDQMRAINHLTLAAIHNGCESQRPKQSCGLTYEDLLKWLDLQDVSIRNSIVDDWKKSYYFGKTVAEHFFNEVEVTETKGKKKIASAKS